MIKILVIDDIKDSLNSVMAITNEILPDSLICIAHENEQITRQNIDFDPDVILMNLNKETIGICASLKKEEGLKIIPVVFIATDPNDKDKQIDALIAGADAFLTNPVEKVELLALIRAMKKVKKANAIVNEMELNISDVLDKNTEGYKKNQVSTLQLSGNLRTENQTLIHTEELLHQSEQSYRNLFEANPHPMYIFDQKTLRFLAVNEKMVQHYGYSHEEFQNMKIIDIRPEEDAERLLDTVKDANYGLRNVEIWRHIKKNNQVIWVEITSHPISWSGKQAVLILAHDITNRKNAEDSLKESNEFNISLLQSIPFGMRIVDECGNVLFVNEILQRMVNADSKGSKCWTLFKEKIKCSGCLLLSEMAIGKTIISESYEIVEERVFQISHTGMLFKGKKAMLEIFQDITERQRIEAELIFAKEKAEESDQLKTSFLANMSHEIRTPLNSIIGFSEMLTDPDYDPTQQFHIARIIHSSGNNLLAIINNILDISKIEAGQVKISKKLFTVNKLLSEIEKDYLFKSIEKGIDFIVDMPNKEEEVIVLSDEAKIRQVLDNFISNSLKFTKRGYIQLGYTKIDDTIEFMVKDSGIGIPTEFHQTIFEHFRQVEAVNTRTHGGNGLGLAISKGLVNILGGDIWMESEKGKGSSFHFSVPIQ